MPDSTERAAHDTGSRYRVLLELGQGGTANVFLAVARGPSGFNKLVVLKALKKSLANDLELRRSFLYEARLSARLNHPNIVAVNEIVEQEGVPVLVMEYLEGQPLSEIIARAGTQLSLPLHLRIISDALSGLQYSHELTDYDGTPLKLVHRDMTPHNLFVTYDGVVKLLDFGIARIGTVPGDTQTGIIKGKLRYMPPEQLSSEEVDRRTDIFAVGVMLWEAAAGDRMWRDLGEATIMNRVINGEFPSPREVRASCPFGLETICMKAMAYRKEDRHATAAELQLEIECLLGEMGQQVTSQDVGRFVTGLFPDTRQQTRRLIEEKLRDEVSLSLAGPNRTSFGPGYGASATSMRSTGPRGKGRRAAVAAASTVALGLASVGTWKLTQPEPSTTPTPAPSLARPATLLLRITVFPARATIYVDGEQVWSNPYAAERPVDDRKHVVRAEAPGHVTATRELRLDKDVDLVIALDPEVFDAASTARPRPTSRGADTRPSDKDAAPAPRPGCDPPYVVDERGIKKFKKECF